MPVITESVELPASPEQVWAVVSDFSRYDEWQGMHKKWKSELPPQSEIAAGIKLSEVVGIMGMDNTIEWTLEEYTPPKATKLAGTGMAGVKVSIGLTVEPLGDGSKVDIEAVFEGQMLVGAIGQAVEKASRAELQTSLEKLKALLA
jgi:carbon monoxide dehydrogenase subunit G